MATSSSSSKQRSQGGGRKSNTEPRVQVFRDFAGCNFEMSPRDFTLGRDAENEQTDLQMNYVVVQNNAGITSNKTIQTRSNIVQLFNKPSGPNMSGSALLVEDTLFVTTEDGRIVAGKLGSGRINIPVVVYNYDIEEPEDPEDTDQDLDFLSDDPNEYEPYEPPFEETDEFFFTDLAYADDKLIAMSSDRRIFTGSIRMEENKDFYEISNAKKVPDPYALTFANLRPVGSLRISEEYSDSFPFRIGISYTYVNKFGPTLPSEQYTFYANTAVAEWNGDCYLIIESHRFEEMNMKQYAIEAVELYYTVDNASSLIFAARTDTFEDGEWSIPWVGYLEDTSMWTLANLIAPTENYTTGVRASQVNVIDGRIYFWGADPLYRLYIGGNPGNLFSISPGTGGGFVDIDPGSGQEIKVVDKYKTQSGNSIVTILCDSPNSQQEKRHNLVENSISLSNEQTMKSWQSEEVAGAVGCKSYYGADVCEDGLYSVSRYGLALTTMTMEYNSQIKTTYVSDQIKPIFTSKNGTQLEHSTLLNVDGILYLAFGKGDDQLDNMIFCYDIDLKSWWTITLDIHEPILKLINIDYEGGREGIGIITPEHVYLLPTTKEDATDVMATFDFLIETGEMSTTMPMQQWQHISQLEFNFDHFYGNMIIECIAIDQFGRKVETVKKISHSTPQYNLTEFMRIDLKLRSYKLKIYGKANFRLTHFMAKTYVLSNKVGLVYGFDDSQSYRRFGDIHPTFKDYNDIRKAIIP